jgi:hypothetical protein
MIIIFLYEHIIDIGLKMLLKRPSEHKKSRDTYGKAVQF